METIDLEAVGLAICSANGYTFVGRVGTGAFKETFHVVLADGTPRALKIYNPGFSPQRIEREIDAVRRCVHPNIVRLSSVFLFPLSGSDYLVSLEEYLPGGTLKNRIEVGGLFTGGQAMEFGGSLIGAIEHIASHDLVHRDIKPDNIIFRDDAVTPVIVDFGLVRDLAEASLTQTWQIRGPGTPYFAPPEQLLNDKDLIDWRSDQFSLGVVLSVCTFGFHPYAEENATSEEVVTRVAKRSPATARFINLANSRGYTALIKMTSPWPVERIRKPRQLAELWRAQRITD